ncbi:MAG TPA: hypothetical protein VG934_00185, partial [Candidatus Paceibacterota bacterium]|nr:hypothetical protein [Candidatus Paceibacterota bacterium]
MTAKKASAHSIKNIFLIIGASALVLGAAFVFAYAALPGLLTVTYSDTATSTPGVVVPTIPPLDKVAYDTKLLELAHVATSSNWYVAFMAGTTTITLANST